MIGAALGTTDDPTRLIPGSVEALHTDASEMVVRADALQTAAEEVGAQVIAGWLGAAAGGWDERRMLLGASLLAVAEAQRVAARAMRDHAEVLAWGQGQAALAIEIWDRALVMAAPPGSALEVPGGATPAPFRVRVRPLPAEVDPLTVRDRAEVVLADARAEVTRSSEALAGLLDQLSDGLPDGRWHLEQFFAGLWGWVTGLVSLVLTTMPHRMVVDHDGWEADRQAREDQLRATVEYLGANPDQTLDVLLDLQTLEDNPAAWWGGMAPDLVLGAAGVGGVARLARVAGGDVPRTALPVAPTAKVDPRKFEYVFGRVRSSVHNTDRSVQLMRHFAKIGVYDTPAGRALILEHLDEVVATPDNIKRTFVNEGGMQEVRDSLFAGPGGLVHLETTWVIEGATRRLTTVMTYGGLK